jgi:HK97 family phage prohead protease
MDRAYSTIDIKAMTDDKGKRRFSGIATTPTVDRMGDIVEPKGAAFQLPIPLLWQHDSRQPIGWVTGAKVTDDGIVVDGEVAMVDDAGTLKNRLDEAWQSMKAKLVRGLSIGFQGLETARIKDTYSLHYLKWTWLELSAVTVPANADATITSIKSADLAAIRAASGARRVLRLDIQPGDSGQQKARRKGVLYLD